MSDIAIRVENLGKQYRIGKRERYRTLRDSLTDAVTAPFRRLRRAANGNGEPDSIWALRDVSFEIPRGEVVGIIGRNGAGKSTLLKVLSRITEPTEGGAQLHGRVASLLEVGTGFHPELTGRENIFLNGAILGMRKAEIRRKFDEIVAFAETEKFLDTPVKHYSSGMQMRLAFAVAAHLDPEILVVDEVLAVGDFSFQKRCLGKMGRIAQEGRTILFVSHNMSAVSALCSRAIVLCEGAIAQDCIPAARGIAWYEAEGQSAISWKAPHARVSRSPLVFTEISVNLLERSLEQELLVSAELVSRGEHLPAFIAIDILSTIGVPLMQAIPEPEPFLRAGSKHHRLHVSISLPPLVPGMYKIVAWVGAHYTQTYDLADQNLTFCVTANPTPGRTFPHTPDHGFVVPRATVTWESLTRLESEELCQTGVSSCTQPI